jgi:hypothetical protein
MRVLPIHRLQRYFRELEIAEDKKLRSAGFVDAKLANDLEAIPYYGGPTDLMAALDAELAREEALPVVLRKVEPNGNNAIMWLAVGVLVALHLWRW